MRRGKTYPFLRVGITGGIGSGKSTVCRLFANLGKLVITADEVAHRLADEDPEVKTAIKSKFGREVYLSTGSLDRKRMAAIVFADEEKRASLDSIIHPHVFKAIEQQLQAIPSAIPPRYVIIEAALIFESGMDDSLDYVIVVSSDQETCVKRVMARDNVTRNEVLRRIAAQMPMPMKVKQADFVIQNNGTESALRPTVLFLDTILLQLNTARPS